RPKTQDPRPKTRPCGRAAQGVLNREGTRAPADFGFSRHGYPRASYGVLAECFCALFQLKPGFSGVAKNSMPTLPTGTRARVLLRTVIRACVVPATLLAASCAHMRPATETGFLGDDYQALAPAPEYQVWGVPDEVRLEVTTKLRERIASGQVNEVYVAPAVYRPLEDPRYPMPEAAARRLEGYATRKFQHALAEDFTVVHEPSPGSVTVRLALTDAMNSNVWTNSLAMVVAVPVDQGAVSGELEVVDSDTGERLLAMTATRGGAFFLFIEAFNRHGHVRHGIKKWAKLTSRLLQGR
ncbi:MAG: hypothetical protein ACJAZN_003960, partial [Planctomycetota bacterium]